MAAHATQTCVLLSLLSHDAIAVAVAVAVVAATIAEIAFT